ncbi:MAG TPA: thioesterase family protein [Puia sp.]|nr:thioesterase family protein [Puia sp.]
MEKYIRNPEIRWSDLDPNFHLRHSVYYDYGAYCRVCFLEEFGLTGIVMQQLHFGPILFREEAIFRREIKMGDKISIDLQVTRSRKDFSRWSITHQIFKNETTLAAVINIDGAWMNTIERKLATPPPQIAEVFEKMPRSENFEWQ